jgi:hypothetical protein
MASSSESLGTGLHGGFVETATDRFERRVTEESSRLIRWMFGFFVAYLGVTLSLAASVSAFHNNAGLCLTGRAFSTRMLVATYM